MRASGHNGRVYFAVFSLAGLVAVTSLFVILRGNSDAKFEGKRVSAWFDQLFAKECNSNNVPISYMAEGAFERMTPEVAVPFLTAKLRYRPALDELLSWLKQNRFTSRFTMQRIAPLDRRLTAAGLLRFKGSAASNAVPALLVAWKQDPSMRVRSESVYTLAFVLNRRPRNGLVPWPEFESSTIGEAARRYPDVVQRLGVTSIHTSKISEQQAGAGGNQPVSPHTISTPSAAGSRRSP